MLGWGAGLMALLLVHTGCGSSAGTTSDSTDTPSVELATIDQLPQATSPVVAASEASLAKGISVQKLAQQGISLRNLSSSSFSADSSMAACQTANAVKNLVNDAAMGDRILCYVQAIASANPDLGVGLDQLYGNVPIDFGLSIDDEEGPSKVRLRIKKEGDAITEFEMHACTGSDQSEYLLQTISDGAFTMHMEGRHNEGENTSSFQTDVAGVLNGSGRFLSKEITSSHIASWDNSDSTGQAVLVQEPESYTLTAFDSGEYQSPEGGTGSHSARIYGEGQLLDSNAADADPYDIGLLALGDGANKGSFTDNFNDQLREFTGVEEWDGDTTLRVDSNDFSAAAEAGTLPTISSVSIAFEGDEVYDCSSSVDATISVDTSTIDASCTHLELGYEWVNCWEIIQMDGEQQEGGEEQPE